MTEADNDPPLPESDAKWAMEIGRFVMAFGSIEALTYTALRQLPREPIAKPLINANVPLGLRLDVLIEIACASGDRKWDRIANVMERIKSLSGKRNLLVHNGVSFEMYFAADGEITFEEVIKNRKKSGSVHNRTPAKERIAFEELVRHRKDAEILSKNFLDAIGELTDED